MAAKKTWLGILGDTWSITWDFIFITLPKDMQEWIKNFLKAFKTGATWMSNLIDKVENTLKSWTAPSKKEPAKNPPEKSKEKVLETHEHTTKEKTVHKTTRTIVHRRVTRVLRDRNRGAFERG